MSKIVAGAAIRGARAITKEAEDFLNKALKEHGPDAKITGNGLFLPMANALLGGGQDHKGNGDFIAPGPRLRA